MTASDALRYEIDQLREWVKGGLTQAVKQRRLRDVAAVLTAYGIDPTLLAAKGPSVWSLLTRRTQDDRAVSFPREQKVGLDPLPHPKALMSPSRSPSIQCRARPERHT